VLDALKRLIADIVSVRNEHPFLPIFTWCLLSSASETEGGIAALADCLSGKAAAEKWLRETLPEQVAHLCSLPGAQYIADVLSDSSLDPMVRLTAEKAHLYSPLGRAPHPQRPVVIGSDEEMNFDGLRCQDLSNVEITTSHIKIHEDDSEEEDEACLLLSNTARVMLFRQLYVAFEMAFEKWRFIAAEMKQHELLPPEQESLMKTNREAGRQAPPSLSLEVPLLDAGSKVRYKPSGETVKLDVEVQAAQPQSAPQLAPTPAPAPAASPSSPSTHQDAEPPDGLLCPITNELMEDPVLCADGHSYERTSIQEWLQSHHTSPLTGMTLEHKLLVPNHALRKVAEEWQGAKLIADLNQLPTPCCGIPTYSVVAAHTAVRS